MRASRKTHRKQGNRENGEISKTLISLDLLGKLGRTPAENREGSSGIYFKRGGGGWGGGGGGGGGVGWGWSNHQLNCIENKEKKGGGDNNS